MVFLWEIPFLLCFDKWRALIPQIDIFILILLPYPDGFLQRKSLHFDTLSILQRDIFSFMPLLNTPNYHRETLTRELSTSSGIGSCSNWTQAWLSARRIPRLISPGTLQTIPHTALWMSSVSPSGHRGSSGNQPEPCPLPSATRNNRYFSKSASHLPPTPQSRARLGLRLFPFILTTFPEPFALLMP